MPSINALSIMGVAVGGAALAGTAAWKHSAKDPTMDSADRVGYTGTLAAFGATGALALKHIGLGRLGTGIQFAGKAASKAGHLAMMNPGRAAFRAMGRKSFGLKSVPGSGRVLGTMAIMAAGIGAMAYGAHRAENETMTMSRPDDDRMPARGGARERAGLIGATGDIVFGLNNSRHG